MDDTIDTNYLILSSSEQWPANTPIPKYDIIFTDGCIPSRLHNISDRPAFIPSLDTLPRERQGLEYSGAYDNFGAGSSQTNLLRINPAVEHAIASQAVMVNARSVPANLQLTIEVRHYTSH